jgi:Fe-S-cluster-containing hydrogenase component 2
MLAITSEKDISVVNRSKCIGCGLCATGCVSRVARLELKQEDQRIEPPKDYDTWEQKGL